MARYRIKFTKTGRAKYISHLDMLKIFTRTARRIGLKMEYSQGFNPHEEIVFSAPLPLGMTSEAEYAELRVSDEGNPGLTEESLLERLSDAFPAGIRPVYARKLPDGTPKIMKNVAFCAYLLSVDGFGSAAQAEDFCVRAQEILAANTPVMADKKSKSGVRYVDIRPLIRSFGTELQVGDVPGEYRFRAVLSAGNESNLRPELCFSALAGLIFPNEGEGGWAPFKLAGVHKLGYFDAEGKTID